VKAGSSGPAAKIPLVRRSDVASRSLALGDRIDALASALRAAGVSPERGERLLARAAAATLDAVALDLLLERPEPSAHVSRRAEPRADERPPVRLAA